MPMEQQHYPPPSPCSASEVPKYLPRSRGLGAALLGAAARGDRSPLEVNFLGFLLIEGWKVGCSLSQVSVLSWC